MRVAITGGTGVVGSAVLGHLVAAGHEVRALSRSPAAGRELAGAGAEPVSGDLLDESSLSTLVAGCEIVFNVAGVNELCVRDPNRMEEVNVEGVEILARSCSRAGVRRLVHTSSAVTLGERRGTVGSESSPHRGHYLSEYERTKHRGEKVLFGVGGDLEVVSVNPSSVQGPGRSGGTAKLILDVINGNLRALVPTRVSLVDIDDCARGHLLAAEAGVSGERYVLSSATLDIREAVRLAALASGRDISPWMIPGSLVTAAVTVAEPAARLLGRELPFCREMVRVLRFGHVYDGSRATRDLGLEYTPVTETIGRTVEWFRAQGLLPTPE